MNYNPQHKNILVDNDLERKLREMSIKEFIGFLMAWRACIRQNKKDLEKCKKLPDF